MEISFVHNLCFSPNNQDKSWRVRYMVANQLYELCEAVGPEPTRYFLNLNMWYFKNIYHMMSIYGTHIVLDSYHFMAVFS